LKKREKEGERRLRKFGYYDEREGPIGHPGLGVRIR